MATHSSILAWEIPWKQESGKLKSKGTQKLGQDLASKQHIHKPSCCYTLDTNTTLNINYISTKINFKKK